MVLSRISLNRIASCINVFLRSIWRLYTWRDKLLVIIQIVPCAYYVDLAPVQPVIQSLDQNSRFLQGTAPIITQDSNSSVGITYFCWRCCGAEGSKCYCFLRWQKRIYCEIHETIYPWKPFWFVHGASQLWRTVNSRCFCIRKAWYEIKKYNSWNKSRDANSIRQTF